MEVALVGGARPHQAHDELAFAHFDARDDGVAHRLVDDERRDGLEPHRLVDAAFDVVEGG